MDSTDILALRAAQTAAGCIAAHTGKPKPHHIVIGGAIVGPDPSMPSVLIVQRAAHERSFPNEWEIPGGHVDPGESVLEAVSREIYEETALEVTKVLCEFSGFSYWSTEHQESEANNVGNTALPVCTLQLNFCVLVKDTQPVNLNPDEHQQYAWCTRETLETYKMTPEMKQVVSDSLDALAAASLCLQLAES